MATEKLIVRAVRAGGDRQEVHEIIRRHSMDATRALQEGAAHNDLLERLAADAAFPIALDDITAITDPAQFTGRAPEQVDEFLHAVIDPLLAAAPAITPERETPRV